MACLTCFTIEHMRWFHSLRDLVREVKSCNFLNNQDIFQPNQTGGSTHLFVVVDFPTKVRLASASSSETRPLHSPLQNIQLRKGLLHPLPSSSTISRNRNIKLKESQALNTNLSTRSFAHQQNKKIKFAELKYSYYHYSYDP